MGFGSCCRCESRVMRIPRASNLLVLVRRCATRRRTWSNGLREVWTGCPSIRVSAAAVDRRRGDPRGTRCSHQRGLMTSARPVVRLVVGSVSHGQQPDVGSLAPSNTERQSHRRSQMEGGTAGVLVDGANHENPGAESGTPGKREVSNCRRRRTAVRAGTAVLAPRRASPGSSCCRKRVYGAASLGCGFGASRRIPGSP